MRSDPTRFFISKIAKKSTPPADTDTDALFDPGEAAAAGLAAGSGPLASLFAPRGIDYLTDRLSPPVDFYVGPELTGISKIKPVLDPKGPIAKHVNVKKPILNLFNVDLGLERGKVPTKMAKKAIKDLTNLADDVDDMIDKFKLDKKGVTLDFTQGALTRRQLGSYHPLGNKIRLAEVSPETALHELGHAVHLNRPGAKFFNQLNRVAHKGALAAAPLAYFAGNELKSIIPGELDNKAIDFIQKHAPAIFATTWAASELHPEIRANVIAARHLKATKGADAAKAFLKATLPHAAGRVASLIPGLVGLSLAKKYFFEAKNKQSESEKKASYYMDKTGGLLDKAKTGLKELYWRPFVELIEDATTITRQMGSQIAGSEGFMLNEPIDVAKKIGRAAIETTKSPEFAAGAAWAGIPTALATAALLHTPHGQAYSEKKRQIRSKSSPVAKLEQDIDRLKEEESRKKTSFPLMAGAIAALSGGFLTKAYSDISKIL